MKLTWQVNEEWWGMNCIARHEDYKLSVMWMRDSGGSVWRIDEDYRVRARGVCPGHPAPETQILVEKKLRRLKLLDRFNRLFRRNKYASSAA
jgi:hypothetical protein